MVKLATLLTCIVCVASVDAVTFRVPVVTVAQDVQYRFPDPDGQQGWKQGRHESAIKIK